MARSTQHKESQATVKIVYRTSKTLSDGSHPFWVRITKDRYSKYVATPYTLLPKFWNNKHTSYSQAIRKNLTKDMIQRKDLVKGLEAWEDRFIEAAKELADNDIPHTTNDVVERGSAKRQIQRKYTVLQYLSEKIDSMQELGKLGYANVHIDLKNQLVRFLREQSQGRKDLRFADITVKFLNDFEHWFLKRNNTGTSLSVRFRTLRTIYNRAIAEEIVDASHYPFARNVAETKKFSIGKFNTKTQKRAITRQEITRIEDYRPVGTAVSTDYKGIRNPGAAAKIKNAADVARWTRAKHIFLFSFNVAGINFVDMAQLRWSDIRQDPDGTHRISYTRQKTGGFFNMKLNGSALAIIDFYRPFTSHQASNYVFDLLDGDIHQSPQQIKNRLGKMLNQINTSLKEIGEELNIQTKLTTYVSRHSFATHATTLDLGIEKVRQLMGHQTEAQTRTYISELSFNHTDDLLDALVSKSK
ncbi:site-specific integrase [Fibrella aquatica]|uniref:site-specific integrase n=1 Tax=Fibrella aquatica TaxID=3242487 RepID=UPI0035207C94